MDIYEKARELGEMISESKELEELRKAEEAIVNAPEAVKLFNDFSAIRQEYVELMQGTDDQAKLEEAKQKLIDKTNELQEHEIAGTYIEAKNKMDTVFKTVTDLISKAVNGQPNEEGEGCSSEGCSGCGGGCH